MEDRRSIVIGAWLQACSQLMLAVGEDEEGMRPYVRPEHEAFLKARFKIFDGYLAAASPELFVTCTHLYPAEFQELYESLARLLTHLPTHRAPIPPKCRLCMYFR